MVPHACVLSVIDTYGFVVERVPFTLYAGELPTFSSSTWNVIFSL